jgi:FkbM family methyltransferase
MNLKKIREYFIPNKVLDIGANIGQFYRECISEFPDSYIFLIEASEECEPYLKSLTNNYFIGLITKDNNLYNFYKNSNPISTGDSVYKELTPFYSEHELKIVTKRGNKLDDIINQENFDLIKVDTQGSELDIIRGGINTFKKAKGVILELSLSEYNQGAPLHDEVVGYMNEIGFSKVCILEEHINPNLNLHHIDALFIKKNKDVIITLAAGYDADIILPFIKSLSKTTFMGELIIISYEKININLETNFEITNKLIDYDFIDIKFNSINNLRPFIYKKVIEELEYSNIIFMDIRDVFFSV